MLASLRESLREDLPWLGLVGAYAAGYELLRVVVLPSLPGLPAADGGLIQANLPGGLTLSLVLLAVDAVRPRLLGPGAGSLERRLLAPYPGAPLVPSRSRPPPVERRALGACWAWGGWLVLMATFVTFKGVIPELQPFSWDVRLADLDRWLHGGGEPWRLLQPLVGRPAVTRVLDALYYLWFPVGFALMAWLAVTRRRRLRLQFFVSYGITWILLGTAAATLFSSAGPVYFERVTGSPGGFGALLDYLQSVDRSSALRSLEIQEILWSGYVGGGRTELGGIAAMPSLHVAMPVLYAFALGRVHRLPGALMAAYGLAILVGSVHLGWHYAVDGYASLVAVPLIWWASGRFVRWYEGPSPGRSPGPSPGRS